MTKKAGQSYKMETREINIICYVDNAIWILDNEYNLQSPTHLLTSSQIVEYAEDFNANSLVICKNS